MTEPVLNLTELQEEMVKKIAQLSKENVALADSVEELSKENTELKENIRKIESICKEQQKELERYHQPCKSAPEEPEYLKPEELKLKNLYNQLDEERWFYKNRIKDFKTAIINNEKPDFFKAKLHEAQKQLKRIERLIKHVLK